MQNTTLRPGLLVSLKTTVAGNVRYSTTVLESAHFTGEGYEKSRWETEKHITDPEEHERAKQARSLARSKVASICAPSDFGLLCPASRQGELTAAVEEARAIADAFNANARYTRVSVFCITGRIADNDVEAVRAINSEVSGLLARMEQGVRNLDAKAIREAATRVRSIGAMLSSNAVERVSVAIEVARKAARDIVKAGETAAMQVDQAAIRKIAESRMAFLDLDEAPATVATPQAQGRALDLDPDAPAWERDMARFGAELDLIDAEQKATATAEPKVDWTEGAGRMARRALEDAYPFGYASDDKEA